MALTRHRLWPASSRPSRAVAVALTGAALGVFLSACSGEHFAATGGTADALPDISPSGPDSGDPNAGTGGDSVPVTGSGGTGSGGAGSGGGPGGSGGAVIETTDAGSGGGAVMDAGMETPPREVGGVDTIDAAPVSHPATLIGASPTTLIGNPDGGTQYQDDCPSGQALVGFSGNAQMATTTMDAVNRQIAAHCGVVQIVGTTVTIKPGAALPARGMAGNMTWTRTCPADQVVVGFSGRTGAFVDQLVFDCAPVVAASSAVGAALTPGATTAQTAIGGNGGMAFATVKCGTGELGAGSRVREGDFMDAFSIVCSKATIAP